MPSRWEGYGLVAIEALASGRPVIAFGVDALPELLGPAGLLVSPEDADALGSLLAHLTRDRSPLLASAEAAPEQAALHSVTAMVRATEAVYAAVLT